MLLTNAKTSCLYHVSYGLAMKLKYTNTHRADVYKYLKYYTGHHSTQHCLDLSINIMSVSLHRVLSRDVTTALSNNWTPWSMIATIIVRLEVELCIQNFLFGFSIILLNSVTFKLSKALFLYPLR